MMTTPAMSVSKVRVQRAVRVRPRRAISPTTRILVPTVIGISLLLLWQVLVVALGVPKFVLPPPSAILTALLDDFPSLMHAFEATLIITVEAFFAACTLGILLAIMVARFQTLELCVFPYAVILQVTPIVSIAPLILIWVGLDHVERSLLLMSTIVAFFPILSNTAIGLKSIDPGLDDMMAIYGATPYQRLRFLDLPNALPYLLAGMKISGGLALVGAVVAEFIAGTTSGSGLAWRIMEAGNRLQIAKMFAALVLLSVLGLSISAMMNWFQHLMLRRWHESALPRDR